MKFCSIPYELTVLSIPDGFPWMIFSPSKAHLFTKSSSFSPKECHPCRITSTETESVTARSAAASATQNAADEPKPDPKGRSELITTVAGLNLHKQSNKNQTLKFEFEFEFHPDRASSEPRIFEVQLNKI